MFLWGNCSLTHTVQATDNSLVGSAQIWGVVPPKMPSGFPHIAGNMSHALCWNALLKLHFLASLVLLPFPCVLLVLTGSCWVRCASVHGLLEFISWDCFTAPGFFPAIDHGMLLTGFKNSLYLVRFVLLACNQLNAFQKYQIHPAFSLFRNRWMKEDFHHVPPCPSLRLLNELMSPFFTLLSKSYRNLVISYYFLIWYLHKISSSLWNFSAKKLKLFFKNSRFSFLTIKYSF